MKRYRVPAKGLVIFLGIALLTACHSDSSLDPTAAVAPAPQASSMKRKKYDLAMEVAKAAVKSGNPEVAEAALKQANQESPHAAEPVVMMAQLYVNTGAYQKAASWIEESMPRFKKQPAITSELQRQLGLAYWHLQQPTLAAAAFVAAYSASSHPELVLNNMGVFLDYFANYRAAQACYQRGLQRKPDSDILMSNYALSLLCSGDLDRAQQLLNNRVLVSSRNQSVLTNRDVAVKLLKEGQRAQKTSATMAAIFRRQLGIDKVEGRITQEDLAAINTICQ